MTISRRMLVLSAIGAAMGCERSGVPGPTRRTAVAAPPVRVDYLGIDATPFDGHSTWRAQLINQVLVKRADDDDTVVCQMVVEPSFKAYEAAIHLRLRNARWELVARPAIASLEGSLRARLSKGMELATAIASLDDCIEESVRPIPESLVAALHRVWTEMLLRARAKTYVDADPDGSTYSFAHHHLAGIGRGPSERSLTGRLASLGHDLLEAATLLGAKHQAALDEITRRAWALSSDLSHLYEPATDKTDWSLKRLYGLPTEP